MGSGGAEGRGEGPFVKVVRGADFRRWACRGGAVCSCWPGRMNAAREWLVWLRRFRARWVVHGLTDSAAALSFYGLVSLAPLLLLGVGVAGLLLGEGEAHGELASRLDDVMGKESAGFIEQVLRGANLTRRGGPVATLLAVAVLGYAGSLVLHKLRLTLNTINETEASDPARHWIPRLMARGLSGLCILLFGLLLAAGTIAKGFVSRFADPNGF